MLSQEVSSKDFMGKMIQIKLGNKLHVKKFATVFWEVSSSLSHTVASRFIMVYEAFGYFYLFFISSENRKGKCSTVTKC